MEEGIQKILRTEIEKQTFPGCVVGVVDRGGARVVVAEGAFTYDDGVPKVTPETIYDVASLTKTVVTATLAMQLVDRGTLGLDDPARAYLPEWQAKGADAVTVRHLLSHAVQFCAQRGSDIFQLALEKDKSAGEIFDAIIRAPLCGPPGETFAYTNAASILLGRIVEGVAEKPLDQLADEQLFVPLRMQRTTFHPLDRFSKEEIVPTEDDPWRGRIIQGEVHDESAWKLSQERVVGSAGLFSTATDLLMYLEMILKKGELRGTRYLREETVMRMGENQLTRGADAVGLGWELNRPEIMGSDAGKVWGKTGFTGCVMFVHQRMGRAMVMLSNTIYPRRRPRAELLERIYAPRQQLANLVFKR